MNAPFRRPKPAFMGVPGAEQRGRWVLYPVYFPDDMFDHLRQRAELQRTTLGEIVIEIVERGL